MENLIYSSTKKIIDYSSMEKNHLTSDGTSNGEMPTKKEKLKKLKKKFKNKKKKGKSKLLLVYQLKKLLKFKNLSKMLKKLMLKDINMFKKLKKKERNI